MDTKVTDKPLSQFQLDKRDRDKDILMFWQALPRSRRKLQVVADYFKVSMGTVWYAINGRNDHKKAGG